MMRHLHGTPGAALFLLCREACLGFCEYIFVGV
jgi:hypothetical protein